MEDIQKSIVNTVKVYSVWTVYSMFTVSFVCFCWLHSVWTDSKTIVTVVWIFKNFVWTSHFYNFVALLFIHRGRWNVKVFFISSFQMKNLLKYQQFPWHSVSLNILYRMEKSTNCVKFGSQYFPYSPAWLWYSAQAHWLQLHM